MSFIHEGTQIKIFRSLANSSKSGLSVLRALEIIKTMQPDVLGGVAQAVQGGGSMAAAMRARPDYFPAWQADIVEAGEATGRQDGAFANIVEILEERRAFAITLATGLAYPLVILHMAPLFFCGGAIADVFTGGLAVLPASLLIIAVTMLRFLLPFYLAAGAVYWAWTSWIKDAPWVNRLPMMGSLAKMRFTSQLGSLLKAAVPFDKALRLASASSGLTFVEGTGALGDRLKALDLFSPDELAQLEVAEQTGNITTELTRIAETSRQAWQASLKTVAVMVPPLIYVVILLSIAYKIIGTWTAHFNELNQFMH